MLHQKCTNNPDMLTHASTNCHGHPHARGGHIRKSGDENPATGSSGNTPMGVWSKTLRSWHVL